MSIFSRMFSKTSQKQPRLVLLAPVSGRLCSLSEIPDQAFSQGMLGDGIGIKPASDEILSPLAGTLVATTKTLHAFCLSDPQGFEILVHLGIDTVELSGEGFVSFAGEGEKLEAKQRLAHMDRTLIAERGYSDYCLMTVSNLDEMHAELQQVRRAGDVVSVGEPLCAIFDKNEV